MFEKYSLVQLKKLCNAFIKYHTIVFSRLTKPQLIKELSKRFYIEDDVLYLKNEDTNNDLEKELMQMKKKESVRLKKYNEIVRDTNSINKEQKLMKTKEKSPAKSNGG